jgi:acetyl esterase/lipase
VATVHPALASCAVVSILALAGCVVPNPTGDGDTLPEGYVAPPAQRVVQDVAYGKATNEPGDADAHRLDLYLPQGPSNKVILWMHGGGWWGGDNSTLLPVILKQVARGFVVASVGYRNAHQQTTLHLTALEAFLDLVVAGPAL